MIFAGVITTGDLISYMLFALQVNLLPRETQA